MTKLVKLAATLFVVVLSVLSLSACGSGGLGAGTDPGNGGNPGNPGSVELVAGTALAGTPISGVYQIQKGNQFQLSVVYNSPDDKRTVSGSINCLEIPLEGLADPNWSSPITKTGKTQVKSVYFQMLSDGATVGDHPVTVKVKVLPDSGQSFDLSTSFVLRIV